RRRDPPPDRPPAGRGRCERLGPHRARRSEPTARLVAPRAAPTRRPHRDPSRRAGDRLPPDPGGLRGVRRARAPGPRPPSPRAGDGAGSVVTGSLVSAGGRQRVRDLATPIAI